MAQKTVYVSVYEATRTKADAWWYDRWVYTGRTHARRERRVHKLLKTLRGALPAGQFAVLEERPGENRRAVGR